MSRASGPDCDIGAYEAEPPAVTVNAPTGVSTTAVTLHGKVTANAATAAVQFEFGTSKSYGTKTAVQNVHGVTAVPVLAKLSKLKPGTKYHYALVATSTDGRTTSADHTFTTPAPPRISKLKISPASFAAGHGATISFSDTEKGTIDFLVRHCVQFASGSTRCTKYQDAGTFTSPARKGANSFHWAARVAGGLLKSGHYQVVATPKAAGLTGKALSAAFGVTA